MQKDSNQRQECTRAKKCKSAAEMYHSIRSIRKEKGDGSVADYKDAYVLIVDDNEELCFLIEHILRREGYHRLEHVLSCEEARGRLDQEEADLLILDVNFPGEDGFTFYQDVCCGKNIPVIFLSARDQNEDRLTGLGLGADDYLTKPFLSRELVLRCAAVLRRTYRRREEESEEEIYRVGERIVNLSAGTIEIPDGNGSRTVSLPNKEFQLLKLFLENRGRILTLDYLAEVVWGENYYGYENTLMVHIRKLREKLEENPGKPQWLITMKGLGYRLNK